MSYFRKIGNIVSSQLFTRPNNLLLRSCNLPKVLCEQIDPSVDHLHTVKALVQTISALRSFQQSIDGPFKQQIQSQLRYLQTCKQQYQILVRKFVESNGNLTGEGIANVYAVAEELNLNRSWLENYLHEQIPNKVQYMSTANLSDVLQALKRINSNSPHISTVQKYLKKKGDLQSDYVRRIGNEINEYEYCSDSISSNLLVSALESQTAYPVFFLRKWWGLVWGRTMTYLAQPHQYNLHQN